MIRTLSTAMFAAVLVVALTAAGAAARLSDPYEILAEHLRALGGLERLRSEKTVHFEAALAVAGLSGTVRHWETRPDRSRTEVDLVVISQINGDNGTEAWEVDSNGKLTIVRDPNALSRRDVDARMARFEYLDPESEVFTVTLEGEEPVDGADCYVVRIESAPDETARDWYIGAGDFMLKRSVVRRPDVEERTRYYDYRDVGGVLHSFRQEQEILPPGQMQTLIVNALETDIDIDPSLFDPPTEEAHDFEFTRGGSSTEVPIKFIEKHLFLPVTIECRESLWVLDTGASMSVIDRAYAGELGLDVSAEIKGEGAGNAVDVAFTALPGFSVDGVDFSSQRVAVVAIAPLFRMTYGLEVDGILGYDFLSRFVTRVDFANETLTLYDPSAFEYDGDGTVLDAPLSDNLFSVEATVDGVYSGRWMVDLGAGGITFHAPFVRQHDLGRRPGVQGVSFGAGGRFNQYFSRFETIELGGNIVERPVISMAGTAGDVSGAFAAGERIGNLGNTLFRHFVLYLDYARQRIIVERGDDFGKEFPWDRSGLQLWKPAGDACEVLYVSPDTPAEEAGFEEGDEVLAINGIAVEYLSGLTAIRAMFRGDVGTEYVFNITRDGAPRRLKLRLREVL